MITSGSCKFEGKIYGALLKHEAGTIEFIMVESGVIVGAYKKEPTAEYSAFSSKAKEAWRETGKILAKCTAKNGAPSPYEFGTAVRHTVLSKVYKTALIDRYRDEICAAEIEGADYSLSLMIMPNESRFPTGIPYVKLTKVKNELNIKSEEDVPVRSVEEIALTKEDITWLFKKKYYIINDDAVAEQIFTYLDNYKYEVAYDIESSGLKMNMFGKVGSNYAANLEKWNAEHPDEKVRADYMVGIIFCVEEDVSYYFPARNRKFKNLYEIGVNNTYRHNILNAAREMWRRRDIYEESDMRAYLDSTPNEEVRCDVVLMERVRHILETAHIVTHGGSIEWKTGWHYEINTNILDDTLIMHQLMYKFRSTTSNKGEPSKLKVLAKKELGIDQWELGDFFVGFKDDESGLVKGGKKSTKIDFSYMDYEGTRIYAPADGDCTFLLCRKYKKDLLENHQDMVFIYGVEMVCLKAIGYMEFYGHRLDEAKIANAKMDAIAKKATYESEVRQLAGKAQSAEIAAYIALKRVVIPALGLDEQAEQYEYDKLQVVINNYATSTGASVEPASIDGKKFSKNERDEYSEVLIGAIKADKEHEINLGSPGQVAELFYKEMGMPLTGDKMSVDKKAVKALVEARDENKNPKYPAANAYSEWKKWDTLLVKFFDNLPNFMYPGGYIFSGYGQIAAATGRMSCSKPNAQQYPKSITKIVIPHEDCVFIDADYSQIEYRVLVGEAGEPFLADLFKDPDNDYHILMASLMFDVPYENVTKELRSDAKAFNFGIPYGMGNKSLAIRLTGRSGIAQIEEAKAKRIAYFKNQPNVERFFNNVKEAAVVNKYTRTHFNRYRYYSFDHDDPVIRARRKGNAQRQAGNAVIQGTAADIFKIALARTFMFIQQSGLLGLLLINNLIHDEKLLGVNTKKLNPKAILRQQAINMEFSIDGFPPLYIGAGIGKTWASAKGGDAEIHQHLLESMVATWANEPLRWPQGHEGQNPDDVVKEFDGYNAAFRKKMVVDYITNPENFGKALKPSIGSLLNNHFTYGHNKKAEKLTEEQMTATCLEEFITHEGVHGVNATAFKLPAMLDTGIEDWDYEDEDDENEDDDVVNYDYTLLDESEVAYGCTVNELIRQFGVLVAPTMKACGIDSSKIRYTVLDKLMDFLASKQCDTDDEGAMEIIFLHESNVINRTGIYIKDVTNEQVVDIMNGRVA